MGDPLSIPAGVVGMLSLGIQVCQGLYGYCSAVKERTLDLDNLSGQIQSLESVFRALTDTIPRIESLPGGNAAAIASVNQSIGECCGGVQQLRELLLSLGDSPGDGFKSTLKNMKQKVAFGFRRGELSTLQQKVQALTAAAELALQTLTLDFALKFREDVAGLDAAIDDRLSIVESEMLIAVNTARDKNTSDIALASQEIKGRMDSLETLVCGQYEQTYGRRQSLSLATRLLEKPGALREACDVVRHASTHPSKARDLRRREMLSPYCDCDFAERTRYATKKKTRVGSIVLMNECHEDSRHFITCPLYVRSKTETRFSAQFCAGLWTRLPMMVRASLACTTGAGGFSISPNLSFRVAVKRSKAAEAIEYSILLASRPGRKSQSEPTNEEAIGVMKLGMGTLQRSFQSGESSPLETSPNGATLLHTVIRTYRTAWKHAKGERRRVLTDMVIDMIKMLVLAGAPVDEVDIDQDTPLDLLMDCRWPVACLYSPDELHPRVRLAEAVTGLSDDLPSIHPNRISPLEALLFMTDSPELIQDFDLPPLPSAILNESEAELLSALAKYPDSVHESTYGMTVLHLSSWWPTGLSILLSTEARTRINQPCLTSGYLASALDFSIRFRCEEAVRILLDHGCVWNKFRLRDASSLACCRVIAGRLAERRQKLMGLAREVLAPRDLLAVCPEEKLVDSYAAAIVSCLRGVGVKVPDDLAVPQNYEGIYLSGGLNIKHFPLFFDAGFHDITRTGSSGLTVMQVAEMDLCQFSCAQSEEDAFLTPEFLERLEGWGCLDQAPPDPENMGLNTSATSWHILVLRLAIEIPLNSTYALLGKAFGSVSTDVCVCPCSSAGCLPFTTWLKAVLLSPVYECGHHESGLHYEDRVWEVIPSEKAPELLRYLTFEILGMTHTCCSICWTLVPGYCPHPQAFVLTTFRGSADEIHKEEEVLVERLDCLVAEFVEKYQESGERLQDFVWGYWHRRMREECVPTGDGNRVDITGVVFEEKYEPPSRLLRLLNVGDNDKRLRSP